MAAKLHCHKCLKHRDALESATPTLDLLQVSLSPLGTPLIVTDSPTTMREELSQSSNIDAPTVIATENGLVQSYQRHRTAVQAARVPSTSIEGTRSTVSARMRPYTTTRARFSRVLTFPSSKYADN